MKLRGNFREVFFLFFTELEQTQSSNKIPFSNFLLSYKSNNGEQPSVDSDDDDSIKSQREHYFHNKKLGEKLTADMILMIFSNLILDCSLKSSVI